MICIVCFNDLCDFSVHCYHFCVSFSNRTRRYSSLARINEKRMSLMYFEPFRQGCIAGISIGIDFSKIIEQNRKLLEREETRFSILKEQPE